MRAQAWPASRACADDGRAQVRYGVTPLDDGRVETISVQGKLASAGERFVPLAS